MSTPVVTPEQRRALIVRRHHLGGGAESAEQVAESLVGLHATDPATVYLSVLARGRDLTIAGLQEAMYERRSLVRWMAMRRTLFAFPTATVPIVQAGVSRPLAATLRRQLVSRLTRNGTEPAIEGDVGEWIESVEEGAHAALLARGSATGVQLSADEPRLRTTITPRAPSDLPANVTSSLLVVMSCDGLMVRGTATGEWTTRQHRWEPVEHWFPDGLPALETADAQVSLVRSWLGAFGPAPVSDLEWWTGWTKTAVRAALSRLPVVEVSLGDAGPGVALPESLDEIRAQDRSAAAPDPSIALLPCLDPTPMGYKTRDWMFPGGPDGHYDRNGNLGPTLWWGGEVVGVWGVAASGEVRTRVLVDRGASVVAAAAEAAATLQSRLGGAVVRPVFPTALERALVA
ncbi:winged helix DNA-binding domain-containing protein [Frondihabitans australicus]|uniref:Winged helix DNA-binding protein n=1 Tax=Frondihabitans australicus TaxID=386892 RepID=A0A495IKM1_9MICO|nr:winged helix DNA-binding domain-containing protein [Frondihabitans australicus]RKR76517.1 winged helix DNA-binding protein [Frondihabitans australicus]